MKRRLFTIGLVVFALIAVVPTGIILSINQAGAREFRHQLELARAEGIPITPEQFAASLAPVEEKDNAAPVYRDASKATYRNSRPIWEYNLELAFKPDAETLAKARQYLASTTDILRLGEKASLYRKCRFSHSWNEGFRLFDRGANSFEGIGCIAPQCADYRMPAVLASHLVFRARVAAAEDRPLDAIADLRRAAAIGRQFREDPLRNGRLLDRYLAYLAVRQSAYWAYAYPSRNEYRKEIYFALENLPKLDLRAEHRYDLIYLLSLMDAATTSSGRRELRMRPTSWTSMFRRDAVESRIKFVKAFRAYWAALGTPADGPSPRLQDAEDELDRAGIKVDGYHYFRMWQMANPTADESRNWAAVVPAMRVFLLATASGSPAASVDTTPYIDPFTGNAFEYTFDGKRMVIGGGRSLIVDDSPFVVPPVPTTSGTRMRPSITP